MVAVSRGLGAVLAWVEAGKSCVLESFSGLD